LIVYSLKNIHLSTFISYRSAVSSASLFVDYLEARGLGALDH